MRLLHLANDYSGSTVYRDLCETLDKKGIEQIVFVPVRSKNLVDKNTPEFSVASSKVIYQNILNFYDRINFLHKVRKITMSVKEALDSRPFDAIHAHTWYSDGAVAYELSKIFKIPYIVTVRGTDYNVFYRYMLHLRNYGIEILKNASKIIFISPTYQKKLCSSDFVLKNISNLQSASLVIPNGIHNSWINNLGFKKKHLKEPLRLLYVGRFTKGKNVLRLIKSMDELTSRGIECQLCLIGGGGKEHARVIKKLNREDNISYLGKVTDKDQLREIFRQHDIFVMPSRFETFGLVYIEALSQGLPVVYTAGQGIDGFYDSKIGEAVQWDDVNSIAHGIERIYRNYAWYDFEPIDIVKNHIWKDIADKYHTIYRNVVNINQN